MSISYGAIAGLVAAGAFLLLVLFAIPVLIRLSKSLKAVQATTDKANKTLDDLTAGMNEIVKNSNDILSKTNDLLADVNHKSQTLDPVVETAVELSETVSDLNKSSRKLVKRVSEFSWTPKTGLLSTLVLSAFSRRLRKKGKE
ncbi:MAG: DUF948 domain-containing protein [Lactobacillus sp.]|jgi:uncharacterized protein YoxC|nr:DUF948 domain-containing protein [Lactobacillus sp.]